MRCRKGEILGPCDEPDEKLSGREQPADGERIGKDPEFLQRGEKSERYQLNISSNVS